MRLSTTPASSSEVGIISALSLLREKLLRGVRLSDLEDERDLDLEGEARRVLRDLGGEGLKDADVVDLLRFDGLGEREREDEGVGDRRRFPRSGLRPLPRPPLPL